MEIGEALGTLQVEIDKDEYCGGEQKENHGWKSRIDSFGATPTPAQLCENMKNAGLDPPEEPEKKGAFWDLDDCRRHRYPFQTHHLIPKKHLPKNKVCVWLTDKWTKDPKYQLAEDSNFDTDHPQNGYYMPFATNTYQWKHAKSEIDKAQACTEMMTRTCVQLHQGSHTAEVYADEIEDIETGGYLTTIDDLLELVDGGMFVHVKTCDVCKKKASGKIKVQPLESAVNQTYRVAQLTKGLIDSNRIFVSERAAEFWKLNPK
jgi:hypothetical protein